MKNTLKMMVGAGVVAMAGIANAADVPLTIAAPTFDWSVGATIAGSMLLLAVGIKVFKVARSMIR